MYSLDSLSICNSESGAAHEIIQCIWGRWWRATAVPWDVFVLPLSHAMSLAQCFWEPSSEILTFHVDVVSWIVLEWCHKCIDYLSLDSVKKAGCERWCLDFLYFCFNNRELRGCRTPPESIAFPKTSKMKALPISDWIWPVYEHFE